MGATFGGSGTHLQHQGQPWRPIFSTKGNPGVVLEWPRGRHCATDEPKGATDTKQQIPRLSNFDPFWSDFCICYCVSMKATCRSAVTQSRTLSSDAMDACKTRPTCNPYTYSDVLATFTIFRKSALMTPRELHFHRLGYVFSPNRATFSFKW